MTTDGDKLQKLEKSAVFGLEPGLLLEPLSVPSGVVTPITANSTSIEYKFLYLQNGTFIYRFRVET